MRFNREALSAYRKAQSTASSPERGVADTYNRMASRLDEIEAALKEGRHRQVAPLIEQLWLATFYIVSVLDGSQHHDIIARMKALNLFVMTRLARARGSGLAKDIDGLSGVLKKLSEIFSALDESKQAGGFAQGRAPSLELFRAAVENGAPQSLRSVHSVAACRPRSPSYGDLR